METVKTMSDKEMFKMVFDRIQNRHHRLSMNGTLVSYDGEVEFNTDGYDLAYNLYRLGKVMNNKGEFE